MECGTPFPSRARDAEHHPVEAIAILKRAEASEAQALFIEPSDIGEVIRRSCDP